MTSTLTRRLALLGMTSAPLGAGLGSLLLPKIADACHDYVSKDGSKGCGAYKKDQQSPTSTTSTQQSAAAPKQQTTSSKGLYYRDELCGFNNSQKWGRGLSRLRIGNAPDGKRAVQAVYTKGKSACGANTALELFSGGGIKRAVFEVDVWLSSGFAGPSGKLLGVYGGGNAFGGVVGALDRPSDRENACRSGEGGWSTRIVHSHELRVYGYSYHQNRNSKCQGDNKFGETFTQKASVPTGRWVTFRQEVVMNSNISSNGSVKILMDGKLLISRSGIMYQKQADNYGIKGWTISNMFGGSCDSKQFWAPVNCAVWYRDLRVST